MEVCPGEEELEEFQGGLVLVLFLFYAPDRTGEDDRQVQPRSATRERKEGVGGARSEAEDPLSKCVMEGGVDVLPICLA